MTDSNRLRISLVREATAGATPGSPVMRVGRITGESLGAQPQFTSSNEIRSDRMSADPIKVNEETRGGINFELSFPEDRSFLSELLQSAMYSLWTNTPQHWNDGTADSVITDVTGASGTFTVVDQSGSGGFAGTAYRVGHLVRSTGFAAAANNTIHRVTSSTATTVVVGVGAGLTNDAAPAAAARLKVIGLQGASADITATATGLGSTALDFTTMGLTVGQHIKIGDASNTNFQFAAAANNGWARVTAIAATALTLDNLPSGWVTDAGTGRTVRVFFGDLIRNGTTDVPLSVERSFLAQATPTHIIHRGVQAGGLSLDFSSGSVITGSVDLMGLSTAPGTVANGASYVPATTATVMSANQDVGRIAEAGAVVTGPNFIRRLQLALNNNTRMITAVGTVGAVGTGEGEAAVTGTLETYFGSTALLTKLIAGTPTSFSARSAKNNQAILVQVPRATLTSGSPNAGGKNQDVMLPSSFQASIDALTNAHLVIERVEYFN